MTRYLSTAILAALCAVPASAATLAPSDILRSYNLVTEGNLDSQSNVFGNVFVGGDLTGNTLEFATRVDTAASPYAELTVLGDNRVGNLNVNDRNKQVVIGGASYGNINGGDVTIGALPEDLVPLGVVSQLRQLSHDLAGLAPTATPTLTGTNTLNLTAMPTGGLTVYDLDFSDFRSFAGGNIGTINVDRNGAELVVVNVTGGGDFGGGNFVGATEEFARHTIFNFLSAGDDDPDTDLTLNRDIWGQVLAPGAEVTLTGGRVEGTLFADNVTLRAQVHLQPFTGTLPDSPAPAPAPIPLPAGLPLMAAGLGGLALLRRVRG